MPGSLPKPKARPPIHSLPKPKEHTIARRLLLNGPNRKENTAPSHGQLKRSKPSGDPRSALRLPMKLECSVTITKTHKFPTQKLLLDRELGGLLFTP
ncbi:hypothetical protein L3X38_040943 [Prunus dulcis]|uniref:Uncharacterized protein n=1 Tax=Prunus dulcis TaxID=3755 RepID=A0AAD4YJX8_PRUDU|nr:hypothetical protein L3X38_040943 [Prunus dulcis]